MKIAINTYSFSNMRDRNGNPLSQPHIIEEAAAIGFDAIEFVGLSCGDNDDKISFAHSLAEKAESCGIQVAGYTVGADLLRDGEVERLKREADIAAALGAPFMRHDAAWSAPEGKSFEELLPELASKCRQVTEYAANYGIHTTVENHGHFVQGSRRVIALCKEVDHPNFGLLCDIGNFMCVDEASVHAVREVAPYTIYVHAKDFLYKDRNTEKESLTAGYFPTLGGNYLCGSALGDGAVNVSACLNILKEAGYNGFVSLEFEGPGDVMSEIKKGYKLLRSCVDS